MNTMSLSTVGNRVVGIWGAMFPEWTGTITGYHASGDALIVWDDWCEAPGTQRYRIMTEPSPNGSRIGVWIKP